MTPLQEIADLIRSKEQAEQRLGEWMRQGARVLAHKEVDSIIDKKRQIEDLWREILRG